MSKLARSNSVIFLPSFLDACALWRMFLPHMNMPGSGFSIFIQKPDFGVIVEKDVAIVQRSCTQDQYNFICTLKALGMTVVYELDDNVWNIPKENPAHHVLGYHRLGFEHCIRACDVVSVSTRKLKKVVEANVKGMKNTHTGRIIPIVVVENRLDTKLFCAPADRPKEVVIGWAGSTSHIGDLKILIPSLTDIAKLEHVHIQFRGLVPPEELVDKVEFKPWMPVPEFMTRMPLWDWSLSLAPAEDNEFNSCKSSIKMMEAGYCGIPCLASHIDSYDRFCSHDPELRWLLCAGWSSWGPKLKELVHDTGRREDLGRRMKNVVMSYYTWDKPHEGWQDLLDVVGTLC